MLRDTVAILGAGPLAGRLIAHLSTQYPGGAAPCPIEMVGLFDDRRERARLAGQTVSGTIDDLMRRAQEGRLDRVIVTLPCSADSRVLAIRDRLQALAIDVLLCPDGAAFDASLHRHEGFAGLPLLTLVKRPLRGWASVAKRLEDIVISLAALIFFGPLMGFIAIAVKLDSQGPVLFRQRRHGLNNREIEVFKFRTMRVETTDESGGRQTARGDARITRLGRLLRRSSLDELPQLLNVLKGDMSLVGPRPHPTGMRTQNQLCHEIVSSYAHRHRVKPGLTGWAQINGYRGATTHPEQLARRVELDLFYIENWSLLLDLKILLKTPITLVTTDSAY
jgi:Undecaprenyl-phosphate glucose phosphotransferase